jgi:hypothetical protein
MMDNNFSEYERNLALLGGHHIADAEAYFNARPQIDNDDRRKVFEAGYERGWEALRQQLAKRSLQATPEPADKEYLEWKSLKEEALQLKEVLLHDSDCAVHNEPAYPNGECNCKLAKPAVEWISVKDKLPEEKDKPYQVAGICTKKYVGGNYDGQGKKGIYQDWVIRTWPNNYTHWMPLPAAYESTLISD